MSNRTEPVRNMAIPPNVTGVLWMTALLGALAWFSSSLSTVLLVPPFGATLAILLYLPDSKIAKPLPVICGSVGGAAIGTALATLLGRDPSTAVLAALTAALILGMLKVFHPPGVALAMYPALMHPGEWFALEVVLPFTLVALFSAALILRRRPTSSAAAGPSAIRQHRRSSAPAKARLSKVRRWRSERTIEHLGHPSLNDNSQTRRALRQ